MLSGTFAPITRRISTNLVQIWFHRCVSSLNRRWRSQKTQKIIEHHCFGEVRYPLKVVVTVGISLGMLSTNIGLNRLGLSRSIGSRIWAMADLKVSDFLEINCFGLF